jgi:hypothetical protein
VAGYGLFTQGDMANLALWRDVDLSRFALYQQSLTVTKYDYFPPSGTLRYGVKT